MIYAIAEYCLNHLNGTFFDSINSILNSKREYINLIPQASLYIAFVGINTLDTSVILSHSMLLYSLFHRIDESFTYYFHSNIPLVPLFFSFVLHQAYISPINKCVSLLNRILYSTVSLLTDLIISNAILRIAINFTITSLIVHLFSRSPYKYYLASLILSFCGTYFFLKTYKKSEVFESMIEYEILFDGGIKSYILFISMILGSFCTQILIGYIIFKISSKKKTQ